MTSNWINWVVLGISVFVLVAMGLISSRRVCNSKGEGGFLLAGRSLGPVVGAASIVATGYSGWGFMGSPGVAYKYGTIEVLGNFLYAPAMCLAVLFFASFLYRRALKMGSLTIPEYISRSHPGSPAMTRFIHGFAALATALLLLVFLVGQLRAMGMLGSSWLGISVNQAIVLMIGIIILYTTLGGMAAVAWTDTLMVAGMAAAAAFIAYRIFSDVSPTALLTQLEVIDPALIAPETAAPYGDSRFQVFMIFPYAFLFSAILPYMSVRFLAFRKDVKIHQVALIMAPIACLLSLVPIVGLYVRIRHPELGNADNAMPYFLANFVSPLASGLITLFIIFAMKSTASSVLQVSSSALSHDLRVALFPDRHLSQKHALRFNRCILACLGGVTLVMTLYAPPVMLSLFAITATGTLMATLIGPVLISSFLPGNAHGALASMVTGFCLCGGLLMFTNTGWVEAPLIGCLVSSVVYVVVSRLSRMETLMVGKPRLLTLAESGSH